MLFHGTTDARSFRQWQQVNRYDRKGAHAFYILGPIVRQKEVEDETGEKKFLSFISGLKAIQVFALGDTDGEPLPVYKPLGPLPLMDVAKKWGLKIQYENMGKNTWGSTDPKGGDDRTADRCGPV